MWYPLENLTATYNMECDLIIISLSFLTKKKKLQKTYKQNWEPSVRLTCKATLTQFSPHPSYLVVTFLSESFHLCWELSDYSKLQIVIHAILKYGLKIRR